MLTRIMLVLLSADANRSNFLNSFLPSRIVEDQDFQHRQVGTPPSIKQPPLHPQTAETNHSPAPLQTSTRVPPGEQRYVPGVQTPVCFFSRVVGLGFIYHTLVDRLPGRKIHHTPRLHTQQS